MVRGTKDKEISDFKKLAELKSDSLIHDFTMKVWFYLIHVVFLPLNSARFIF